MIDKVQKIREEVARIQLYTQSEVLKQVLDYIDKVQEEPVSVWHDASKIPDNSEDTVIEHSEYGTTIIPACKMSRVKGAKWARLGDILKL